MRPKQTARATRFEKVASGSSDRRHRHRHRHRRRRVMASTTSPGEPAQAKTSGDATRQAEADVSGGSRKTDTPEGTTEPEDSGARRGAATFWAPRTKPAPWSGPARSDRQRDDENAEPGAAKDSTLGTGHDADPATSRAAGNKVAAPAVNTSRDNEQDSRAEFRHRMGCGRRERIGQRTGLGPDTRPG